jgi:membrane protein
VDRGRCAQKPWQVPWNGWKDTLWRVAREIDKDEVIDTSASVAFFGLLALFPALIATVSMYGMLADPADVARQVNRLGMAVPGTARLLLIQQLNEIQ